MAPINKKFLAAAMLTKLTASSPSSTPSSLSPSSVIVKNEQHDNYQSGVFICSSDSELNSGNSRGSFSQANSEYSNPSSDNVPSDGTRNGETSLFKMEPFGLFSNQRAILSSPQSPQSPSSPFATTSTGVISFTVPQLPLPPSLPSAHNHHHNYFNQLRHQHSQQKQEQSPDDAHHYPHSPHRSQHRDHLNQPSHLQHELVDYRSHQQTDQQINSYRLSAHREQVDRQTDFHKYVADPFHPLSNSDSNCSTETDQHSQSETQSKLDCSSSKSDEMTIALNENSNSNHSTNSSISIGGLPIKDKKFGQSRGSIDKSSEEYRKRRERNNIAVRKSRSKSKIKFSQTIDRMHMLEAENDKLRKSIVKMQQEMALLRFLLSKYCVEDENYRRLVMKQIEIRNTDIGGIPQELSMMEHVEIADDHHSPCNSDPQARTTFGNSWTPLNPFYHDT